MKRHRRQSWQERFLHPFIGILLISGMIFLAFWWSHSYDHKVFKTPEVGKITVVSNQTIFVPKGAYIIGEAHLYSSDEDVVFDDTLPENQIVKFETLVKTYGKAVVYWSSDQKAAALSVLKNS